MAHQPLNPQTKTGKRHPKYVESILTALVKADRTSSLLYLGKKGKYFFKLQPIQYYAITVSAVRLFDRVKVDYLVIIFSN